MAKPERLTAGFELANGRAADRVSEKEAEAGRSRRRSRTTSAAASPWHDPGLRLQRLHKEAFLGAAVSLLVRGRRQAGPRALPCVSRRPPGRVPTGGWPPLGSLASAAPPGRPYLQPSGALVPLLSESGPRPAHRRGPSPANGRADCLPPHLATGGARLAPLLPSSRASPFSLWAETGPLLPAGGWSSLFPPTETGPKPSCPPVGVAPFALPSLRASARQLFVRRQPYPPGAAPGPQARWGRFTRVGGPPLSLHNLASNPL